MRLVVCIRIPSNVYNFRSYIYNMPVEKFVMVLAGISLTAILFTFSLVASLAAVSLYFAFMGYIGFNFSNIRKLRKLYFHGKGLSNIRFINNGLLFGIYGKEIFSGVEIDNRELYTDSSKSNQIRNIRNMINNLTCSANIITRPEICNGANYYRTYIILKTYGTSIDSAMDSLNSNISIILSNPGFHARAIGDEETMNSFFPKDVTPYSRYVSTDGLFRSYLDLLDTDYSQDFLYQTAIEKLGFMVEINMEINTVKNSDVLVKRLLSARKAELVYTKSGHYASLIKKQISSLEYMANQEKLYNVSMRFAVVSKHPAVLRSNTESFVKTMESIGFRLKDFHFFNKHTFNPLSLGNQGIKYMMDSASISEIFPCSFTPVPSGNQKPLAVNAITGKALYFKPFSGNSYNIAITGETGSGKSYFTKRLLNKMNSGKIYIIDPLSEYNSDVIVDLSLGEYIDFSIETPEMFSTVAGALEKITGIPGKKITGTLMKLGEKSGAIKFSKVISELDTLYCRDVAMSGNIWHMPLTTPVMLDGKSAVFRFDHKNESLRDAFFRLVFTQIISIVEREKKEKVVVIDESHLFLRNSKDAEIIDMLARNSRHFKTSLVTVTQNIEDYYMNSYSESVLMNSINYFIFRQHGKIKDRLFLGYEIDPAALAGGNSSDYYECFYATGTLIRKLKIYGNSEK